MEDERIEHLVRQRVLLVQQDADEERRGACPRGGQSCDQRRTENNE
jgi:hypothetical protein